MVTFHVKASGLPTTPWLNDSASKAAHLVALEVRKDTAPFVPALTMSLAERARVRGGTITYPGPYARYLYFGKLMVDPDTGSSYAPQGGTKVLTDKNLVFNTTVHGQAQDHWFEASRAQNGDKWRRIAGKAMAEYARKG